MGRSRMALIKETVLPLVIFLLLTLRFPVSGKPKTFLIETNDKYIKNDYSIKNPSGVKTIVAPKGKSLNQDYRSPFWSPRHPQKGEADPRGSRNKHTQDVINVTRIADGKDDLEAIVLPCPIKRIHKNKKKSIFRSWTVTITDC